MTSSSLFDVTIVVGNQHVQYTNTNEPDAPTIRRGYYNGGVKAIERDGSNVTITPEFRDKTYTAEYSGYIEGYQNQSVPVYVDVTENKIDDITYIGNFNIEHCNLIQNEIQCNLSSLFSYTYLEELDFIITCNHTLTYDELNNRKPFDITLQPDGSNMIINADVRDMWYRIDVEAIDINFGCNNTQFSMIIHEQPPVTITDNLYISNLTNITCNILLTDYTNNRLTDISLVFSYNPSKTPNVGYYNGGLNAITTLADSIILEPEYRDDYYYIDTDVHVTGYQSQSRRTRIHVHEQDIMQLTNEISLIEFSGLSNNEKRVEGPNTVLLFILLL